jgi:4-oxalocrotonate tautomerase
METVAMPLVRIALLEGKRPAWRSEIGDAVHRALVATIGVPEKDRFQLISELGRDGFIYDAEYLGITRSRDLVMVQITLSFGRTLAQKRALYRAIADNLAALGLRREDVWINLVETAKENWSFGNGVASYAPEERESAPA